MKRSREFAKDLSYEDLLQSVNEAVEGFGERGATPRQPLLFIMGAPRSGTTLTYQLLAATLGFHYPSNLIARFYRSPAWGARTQRLLAPLLDRGKMSFTSRAGNTDDWWGPHEFGYFWQRHLALSEHHEPEPSSLEGLCSALAAFENESARPMLFKNNILCLVARQLQDALPTARFLWVRRRPLSTAASIYRTRIRFYEDPAVWWSLRPADVDEQAPVADQIAHQIKKCDDALTDARDRAPERWREVSYAEVCEHPRRLVTEMAAWLDTEVAEGDLPPSFPHAGEARAPASVLEELEWALQARGLTS